MNGYISKEELLLKTRGGLDIILYYLPQARDSVVDKRKKFAIRNEKDPSANLSEHKGTWYVKDFGSSDKAKNAIAIAMEHEGISDADGTGFTKVLKVISKNLNLTLDGKSIYQWNTQNITTFPAIYTELIWLMTDGTNYAQGSMLFGGWPDDDVTTDSASREASKATGFATAAEQTTQGTKIDTINTNVTSLLDLLDLIAEYDFDNDIDNAMYGNFSVT